MRTPLAFFVDGPTIRPPDPGWRTDPVYLQTWAEKIRQEVDAVNAWALIGMRADGDLCIFDRSSSGINRCAAWSVEVRLIFPSKKYYDPENSKKGDMEQVWRQYPCKECGSQPGFCCTTRSGRLRRQSHEARAIAAREHDTEKEDAE